MTLPKKVLMVDDDRVQLAVVRAWLESKGVQVITNDSPFGTSKVVIREQPDVVLLDVEMPALEGKALAEVLSRDGRASNIRIIFYSGKDEKVLDRLVRECHAAGAIRKTNNAAKFFSDLSSIMERPLSTER